MLWGVPCRAAPYALQGKKDSFFGWFLLGFFLCDFMDMFYMIRAYKMFDKKDKKATPFLSFCSLARLLIVMAFRFAQKDEWLV